jgi:hypothetical protein
MANIEWRAFYFASLYVSSASARMEPDVAEGEDDAASVAGVRMDVCKRIDTVALIAEPPGHYAILAREDPLRIPALH